MITTFSHPPPHNRPGSCAGGEGDPGGDSRETFFPPACPPALSAILVFPTLLHRDGIKDTQYNKPLDIYSALSTFALPELFFHWFEGGEKGKLCSNIVSKP